METTQKSALNVVIVSSPGMGHLIPLVEFANLLVDHHQLAVTFIMPNDGSAMKRQRQLLSALPHPISSIFLPPVSLDDLPQDAKIEARVMLALARSLPLLKDSLNDLTRSTRVPAVVLDVFAVDAIDVVKEFGLQSYIFNSSNAMSMSLVFELPKLDQMFSCEFRDLPEPIKLPGCVPFHGRDIVEPLQNRKDFAYQAFLQLAKRLASATGIICNSFMELEKATFEALMGGDRDLPAIYPVGPLIQTGNIEVEDDNSDSNDNKCLRWLDKQPSGSVLFICFGSAGVLSHQQLNELALGLEMSGQRFLWVVKDPNPLASTASYFGMDGVEDPFAFLPHGFMERTKNVGMVVSSWAPQIRVLSHGSTGGFMTHSGWNSILESVVHSVPLIAWPLYAEQKMNSVLLEDGLKVAFRVKVKEDSGVVGREDIAKYAKELIQGEEGQLLRGRMRELKEAAKIALSPNGSSTKSLAKLVETWKNHQN